MQITHRHGSTSCFKNDSVSECNSVENGEIWPPLSPIPHTDDHQIWHGWWGLSLSNKRFSLSAPAAHPCWRVDTDSTV